MIPALPVLATVIGAYAKVFQNLGVLLRASLLPVLAMVILNFLHSQIGSHFLWSIVFWLLELPFVALIAIACHRVVLLGSKSLASRWSLHWSDRETSFYMWLLILGAFFFVITQFFAAISFLAPDRLFGFRTPWLGIVLVFVGITYLEGRFSMVFPATAVGNRMILSSSWYLTAGNGLRVTASLVLPLVAWFLVAGLGANATSTFAQTAMTLFAIFLLIVTLAVEIAVLSLSYRFLTDSTEEEGAD